MFELSVSWVSILTANVIIAIASVLQASVGIGLALLAVPLLALVDTRFVPGPLLLAGALLAFTTAYREWHAVDVQDFGLALLGLALGTVCGALALRGLSAAPLSQIFAGLILLAVAVSVSGVRVRPSRAALLTGGSAAGILGTMVGIHGPPIALVLQHARPEQARALLGAFFFVAYLGSVATLGVVGLFGLLQVQLAVALLPGVVAGLCVAPYLVGVVNPARLRGAILSISAASAVALFLR